MQSLDQNRHGVLMSDISNDSTHGVPPNLSICRCEPAGSNLLVTRRLPRAFGARSDITYNCIRPFNSK
jgi:hypothetical protein